MAIQFEKFTASQDYSNKKKKADDYQSQIENYGDFKESDYLASLGQKNQSTLGKLENYGDFTASDYLNSLQNQKINAENAVANYGDFAYKNQAMLEDAMNAILNRKDFSYDLNGDALYQQYKDQYMRQGNMAMQDTIGQASAMTGGYGNSYAQSVGQQTYQGYLQNLNDKIPEFYQLALDKYNQEGQDALNRYSLLADDRNTEYGLWGDKYNRLVADRDYAGNNYYNEYSKEYGEYNDNYSKLVDLQGAYESAYHNQYNREYGEHSDGLTNLKDLYGIANTAAQNLYTQEYGAYSDDIANQKWREEYDLKKVAQDQSATIAALKQQVLDTEAKYEGYLSPAMQKAANSQRVHEFIQNIYNATEFRNHGNSASINGKQMVFDNYNQYVDAMMETMHGTKLTDDEVEYLKGLYGIDW